MLAVFITANMAPKAKCLVKQEQRKIKQIRAGLAQSGLSTSVIRRKLAYYKTFISETKRDSKNRIRN